MNLLKNPGEWALFRSLANRYNLTPEEVRDICHHQFKVVRQAIYDPEEERDIRLKNLFNFSLKKGFRGKKTSSIKEVFKYADERYFEKKRRIEAGEHYKDVLYGHKRTTQAM